VQRKGYLSAAFQQIASKYNAEFHEVYVDIYKVDAVNRLINRGCWGEKGSRALTENDREELEGRFDYMDNVMQQLPNVVSIGSELNDIDSAYHNLITALIDR